MRAMLLEQPRSPLLWSECARPEPGPDQVLLQVKACGVCRTDLHVSDGELTQPKLPLILGHEIVGIVEARGERVERIQIGDRVGVPWLGWTCGECRFCLRGQENLCEAAQFTGYQLNGGYAEFTVADQRYCFLIPAEYSDAEAAPLLCAGLIGYRSLQMCGDARRVGIFGFGAAGHIVAQVARFQGRDVFAFTRPGDLPGQQFARELGAVWAGSSEDQPPELLDAAIVFAPVGALVPQALQRLDKAGIVVCSGIHMSDIPRFAYELLWGERIIRSVANLTRPDAEEFLQIAPQIPVRTVVQTFALSDANAALLALREGRLRGAAVLVP